MALTDYRRYIPIILLVIAPAFQVLTELTEQQQALGTASFYILAAIANMYFAPITRPTDRMPRIIWDERDEGEKLSIVMFHALIALGGGFFAYSTLQIGLSQDGTLLLVIPAIGTALATCWFIWTNWSNRNAR
jgi:hypothetical protein